MLNRIERCAVILFAVIAIVPSFALLTACAAPTPNPFQLANTKWTLTGMMQNGANQPPVVPEPTLEFQTDTLGGNAGCNSYGGSYKTQGEMIQIGALRSTLMACADEQAMAQESAFLEALQNARMFEVRDDRLSIIYGQGQGQLVFARTK